MSEERAPLRLGGMALRNGLLVNGPTSWAAAIRASDGSIRSASGRLPRWESVGAVPGLRGVVRLGEAISVIPLAKRALPEARMPVGDGRALGAALAVSVGGTLLRRRGGPRAEALALSLSLLPAMVALRGGELAQYHGAEHKTIAGYERGVDAASAAKEHERCGSHLVVPLLASNAAAAALLRHVVTRPGPLAGAAVGLGSIAGAVEVFAWTERHPGSPLARALKAPGDALQRAIGTREPTDAQLEVAAAALSALLVSESGHSS